MLGPGGHYGSPFIKDQLHSLARHVEGGVIPDCGHMVTEEVSDLVSNAFLAFFRKVPAKIPAKAVLA